MSDDPNDKQAAAHTRKVVEAAQVKVAKTQEKVAKAQDKVVTAAKVTTKSQLRQEKSALRQEGSADRRTELAADRTVLAAERTYAAWMRTGLASMASAVGAVKLLEGVVADWIAGLASLVLALFAGFAFIAAVWREMNPDSLAPNPDVRKLPGWVMIGFSAFMAVVSLAVVIGLWSA